MSCDINEMQHKSKVQQSLKDYVDIRTLNSGDFVEWLKEQNVVGFDIIQEIKG